MLAAYRITYKNGIQYVTSMNATLEEAKHYFLGQWVNLGDIDCGDNMQQIIGVEEV